MAETFRVLFYPLCRSKLLQFGCLSLAWRLPRVPSSPVMYRIRSIRNSSFAHVVEICLIRMDSKLLVSSHDLHTLQVSSCCSNIKRCYRTCSPVFQNTNQQQPSKSHQRHCAKRGPKKLGEVVKFGPEASAKLEIVVLQVDHDTDETNGWTLEEFNKKIVREREGKKCLLRKRVFLTLKEGVGSVDTISFTQISTWMRKRQFRLGARMVDNFNGTRVKEAISEPFIVKDNRGNSYEKHGCPSLNDDVWRLKNIRKGGPLHRRLKKENIKTVQDFLTQFFINPQKLQDILGCGMPAKKLDIAVKHGLTCNHDNKYLYHLPGSQQKTGIVLNDIRQVVGVVSECHYSPIDRLSQTEKAKAQKGAASALEHWGEVVRYDEIHKNSLFCSSSHLANAHSTSNSPILDTPSGPNVDTAHMFSEYDTTQPSISFPDFDMEDCPAIGTVWLEELLGSPFTNCNAQGSNPSAESDAYAEDGFLFANEKAQIRRWLKVSIVLRFLLRKTIKVSNHVQ